MTFTPQQLAARRPRNGSRPATERPTNATNANAPAAQNSQPPQSPPPAAEDQGGAEEAGCANEVMLDVPLGDPGTGYASGRIDFAGTPRQAAAAKMLARALESRGERFAGGTGSHPDGTIVQNANGAIRWLLDRIADGFEAETGKVLTADFNLIFR